MKAAARNTYGPPEVLSIREIDHPVPKNNELLVRVFAATVNRTDCGILRGNPFIIRFFTGLPRPSRQVTGTDFAGRVEAVGSGVKSYQPGDRIWGFDDNGLSSHAEYLVLPETKALATIPEGINYEVAAASPEGAHYAYNFINKIPLREGDKVLVNGASGAIGSAAVQLLKYFGVEVTAVCDTKNIEGVKKLGADFTIDYTAEDFTKKPHKYHFVLDAVGKSTFGRCRSLLLPGGTYISSELGPGGENLYLPLVTRIRGGEKVVFPVPLNIKRTLLFLRELMDKGKFRPLIDRKYSLENIVEAYHYVETGQKAGNVLVLPGMESQP